MANNEWDRDRDRNRDWDRDRNREWDRDREYEQERRRHEFSSRRPGSSEERRTGYGSHAGWGGQPFSQGSFGSYGGQGERLYTQYGGQGSGAEHGYTGRETGGGMSLYSSASERDRYTSGAGMGSYYQGRGDESDRDRWERERRERERSEYRDRDREQWGREWGGQGFSGREGGWGGYGSYDREHGGWERGNVGGYERERAHTEMWGGRPRRSEGWDRGYSEGRNWPSQGDRESRESSSSGRDFGAYGSYGSYSGQGARWNEGWSQGERGRFVGRGPRNWKRSDDRIKEDINERLTQHPDVDASDIDVEVNSGEVTLKGKVDDRHAKRLAEDIAEGVSGVIDVRNEIKISRGFFGAIGDALTGRSSDEDDRDRDRREATSAGRSGVTSGSSTGSGSSSGNITPSTGSNQTSTQKTGEFTGTKK